MAGRDLEEVDFSDFKASEAWFEKQPLEIRHIMTSRAALRVVANIGLVRKVAFDDLALPVFRAVLVSAVRGSGRTADTELAANSAKSAVNSAVNSPNSAVNSAALSVNSAALSALSAAKSAVNSAANSANSAVNSAALSAKSAALSAALSALSSDARVCEESNLRAQNGGAISQFGTLWPQDPAPEALLEIHRAFLLLLEENPNWQFFKDWYLAMWEGTFDNWDLAHAVALIDDDVWEEGLAAVAAQIDIIERKHRTNVSPQLVQVSDGIWGIENDVSVPQEPLDFAITQVQIALKAALAAGQNNGLRSDSGETVLIETACTEYRHQPSVVATSFWNACMGLQRSIGDIYPEDSLLIILQNTLYTSVEELCEQDPLIKSRIAKLAALETRRYPTQEEILELQKVPDAVVENMTHEAQEKLREMVDIVSTEQKPPRLIRAKLVNWITTLGSGIDRAQKGEKRAKWLFDLAKRISGWFFDENDPPD